ncbi:vWA domain-containing protein [uncultured Thiodictyon sp.]|uniref:vWA domain-containing protein n=1 Tax=uncultured Thiodictyon sp. TaxID=1846217 RepID=UPI0025CCB2BA|nr:vWA domain-containing protein [uncultured Thiodictyon sp.]
MDQPKYRLPALALVLLACTFAVVAEPLHPPGKRAVYERVLTRPGAVIAAAPGTGANQAPNPSPIKALSRLYVYAREGFGGQDWLRVGTGTRDQSILGWLPAAQTIPWKQQLTLAFTNQGAGREPMLFLRSWDDLRAILDSPNPGEAAGALRRTVDAGRPDPRILAVEPANFIDLHRHFYLLPILDFAEVRAPTGDKVRALKVASVTLPGTGPAATTKPQNAATPSDYRAAVVFVIDSTVSMGPYIAQTKAAVGRFYQQIAKAGLLDRVAFGLVAFRAPSADPAKARGLEFVARTYANPAQVQDGRDFLRRVSTLDEARVSTDRFDEDPYAGIQAALDAPDWRQRFAERHIILITDAGALDGTQRDGATGQRVQSSTGLDALRLRSLAGEAGTSIAVLHLLTPKARRLGDTEAAAGQYRTLSTNAVNQQSAYFPIADGSVAAFGTAIDAYAGRLIENLARPTGRQPVAAATPPKADDQSAQSRAIVDSLGHAAQLAYLGQVQGTRAPEVFEAWISDKDFADPSRFAVDVRVLLTKDQLSDLQLVLKGIVEAAETDLNAENTARSFFNRLASVAARFSVDPLAGGIEESTRLADLGLLGEYLQGLPYKSDVLTLTQDTWTRWGTMRQYEFIDQLNKKIRRYGLYYADQDKWVDLAQSGTSDPAELVYPIPLTDLP